MKLAFWRKSVIETSIDLYRELFGITARMSSANKYVDVMTALRVSTVLCCARVLADGVSQVPFKLYQRSADGRMRNEVREHPLFWILHRRPNAWQTSFEFRETLMLHLALTGNAYCFINRGSRDEILELIPFEPNKVHVERKADYSLVYRVSGLKNGSSQDFPQESIWHIKGPSWSSWLGLDAVKLARDAIGLGMAAEEHHAKSFTNGARPGSLLSVDGTLTPKQYGDLKEWVDKEHGGSKNSFNTLILDRNAKWFAAAFNSVDMQLIETRRFAVEEQCRFFRVMPIMVGAADKTATYASAEQMFLAHVVHTMAPWYERIEQSVDAHLISDADAKKGIYAKFVEEGLLRGALKDTAVYLSTLSTNGIITRNEARGKLELNPIDGLDEPLTPRNMQIGTEDDPAPDKPTGGT